GRGDRLVELGLVVLDREQVVAAAFDNRARDLRLAARGVDGHEAAFEMKEREQAGNRLDLVRVVRGRDLPKDDTICSAPCADHADEASTAGFVERASQGFAIDGHDTLIRGFGNTSHPAGKKSLERRRVELRENATQRVVRRDAIGQLDEALEKILACKA